MAVFYRVQTSRVEVVAYDNHRWGIKVPMLMLSRDPAPRDEDHRNDGEARPEEDNQVCDTADARDDFCGEGAR